MAQNLLFALEEEWRVEWVGMPAFAQEDMMPLRSLIVNFASRGDLEAFGRLVEQSLTMRTRSIWYPPAPIGHFANKRYADES